MEENQLKGDRESDTCILKQHDSHFFLGTEFHEKKRGSLKLILRIVAIEGHLFFMMILITKLIYKFLKKLGFIFLFISSPTAS
ncbi:hypothetical protein [Neobacillus drentensis]|uniref:hypothetical protein n=1 Tax=Neobacillus drentensis TaxID=220684 RepID=UPI002FFE5A8A